MYEQQEYKRGQIYDVGAAELLPGEQGIMRPGLIVSSNIGNQSNLCVVIAFLTTVAKDKSINYGPIKATGKLSYVLCNQLQTVSKKRLGRLMGQISENEMLEVDKCLEEALDLGYVNDTPLKEKEKEIEILKIQLKELREKSKEEVPKDVAALRVAADMWKGLYEKALDMLIGKRLSADLELLRDEPVEPVRAEEPEQPKLDVKADINTATFNELRALGFTGNIVLNIINNRPYAKIEDLKKVPGITAIGYNIVKNKICCVPVEPEPVKAVEPVRGKGKVNVNTASVNELANTGMGTCTASQIERWRRRNGEFGSLEDLLKVPRFGPRCLEKYGKMLEV